MTDHLRLVTDSDDQPLDTAPGCYTKQELHDATALLLEHLQQVAEETGLPMGDFIESDVFGLHTLAYIVTLRHTDDRVHERANGLFFRLLHRTTAHRDLALGALGHVYRHAEHERPSLHVVES
ncbi:hypothetical protein E1265_32585 [Streptomyces sp. 8K308]|uniref:hypothetical protein n=1 Tax=Streptomyces sp. 8K308 TaxID=2530388 RepID=UPI0010504739|nr:hypothetical protein [Streptomyces sp. 8K308]TDC09093.1 hypothetical protein E1265_32585 [Streptomyces sp. 8K308]